MRAIVVVSLALAACSPNLTVPSEAKISCEDDNDCPERFACRAKLCTALGRNEPPALALGSISRTVGLVAIPVKVFDAEADTVQLAARFSTDGGAFANATLEG